MRTMIWLKTGTMAVLAASAVCVAAQEAATVASFDGRWTAMLTCDDTRDNDGRLVKGYSISLPVEIQGGRVLGERGSAGVPGYLKLSGAVVSGGGLELVAQGTTGSVDRNMGLTGAGRPYSYTLQGRLEGDSGSAVRRELRPCKANFVRG
jgi:hypothetical protein